VFDEKLVSRFLLEVCRAELKRSLADWVNYIEYCTDHTTLNHVCLRSLSESTHHYFNDNNQKSMKPAATGSHTTLAGLHYSMAGWHMRIFYRYTSIIGHMLSE